jgi:hypothetical protein
MPTLKPITLPAEKRRMVEQIRDGLGQLAHVQAVVLGGSQASGLARPDSDLDIGVYYREGCPFSVDGVRAFADGIARPETRPVATGFYEWGPWVNGGAWIQTPVGKVDLLYRNLDQVEATLEEGQRGVWRHDYDQQPPYGFRSVIYFGEIEACVPLYDLQGQIARLKEAVRRYPEPLKARIVRDSLWGAEFSLLFARQFAERADVYNAAGCLTRVAQYLTQALFALNERYFLSDKDAARVIEALPLHPPHFQSRLASALARAGAEASELHASVTCMRELWSDTVELTNGTYRSRFEW